MNTLQKLAAAFFVCLILAWVTGFQSPENGTLRYYAHMTFRMAGVVFLLAWFVVWRFLSDRKLNDKTSILNAGACDKLCLACMALGQHVGEAMNRRKMMITSGGFLATLPVAGHAFSSDSHIVETAKAVIKDHEDKTHIGNLDEIVINIADDVVLFAPGIQLVQGIESFRGFYASLLEMGTWTFNHDYSGHDVQGDSVIVYGVARGNLKVPEGEATPIANNFLIVVRPISGQFKIWRAAFAPIA